MATVHKLRLFSDEASPTLLEKERWIANLEATALITRRMIMVQFDFNAIQYPAFVVVYGRSKHYISSHNRTEYDEHFACDYCRNAEQAARLLEGCQSYQSDVKVYAAVEPQSVVQVLQKGVVIEYDSLWGDDPYESLKDRIREVISTSDAKGAVAIANVCYFKFGMTYRETYEFVRDRCDRELSLPEWGQLLREGE